MAAETLSGISSSLAQTFAPQLVRIWNRTTATAKALPLKTVMSQGMAKNLAWDVEYSGATAASFAEGSDVDTSADVAVDPTLPATLSWGMYRSAFKLSNLEINAAAQNMGNATALEDMVGERMLGSITKITSLINSDIFVGDGTDGAGNPTIIGFDTIFASSGSYANIDPGTYTEWVSTVSSNGSVNRPLTMNLMSATESALYTACGESPDMLVTTPNIHTKYEGLFESARRTIDEGRGPVQGYYGSTNRLYWRGTELGRDKDATANRLYMLNSQYIDLCVLPWVESPDGVMVRIENAVSSNGTDMESFPLPFHVYPLGRKGSSVVFVVEVYAQLRVKKRNAFAVIKDISES